MKIPVTNLDDNGMIRFLPAILLFLLLLPILGAAQSACETTLIKAQEEFDAGRFDSVPTLLEECLKKNQNRDWEQRAYLLLSETYLLLENPAKADESYLKVLHADPEFLTDESRDPIDLVYLSKKFTATPIFSFYGKVGLNTSFIHVIHDVDISSGQEVQESYSLRSGWQGGLGLDYHYTEKLGLAMEFNYMFTSFSYTSHNLFRDGDYSLDFNDRQTWVSIPVLAKYTRTTGILRPYGYLGYSVNFLMRDRADLIINNNIESQVFDFKDKRAKFTTSAVVGGGLKYKWGLRYLFADVRFSMGLLNMANPSRRYSGITESWPYVDDDFRMNTLFLSVGYTHPLYKPRQLKNVRTKSVLRKLKRRDDESK